MLYSISSVHLAVKVMANAIQIAKHEGDQPAGPHNGDISEKSAPNDQVAALLYVLPLG